MTNIVFSKNYATFFPAKFEVITVTSTHTSAIYDSFNVSSYLKEINIMPYDARFVCDSEMFFSYFPDDVLIIEEGVEVPVPPDGYEEPVYVTWESLTPHNVEIIENKNVCKTKFIDIGDARIKVIRLDNGESSEYNFFIKAIQITSLGILNPPDDYKLEVGEEDYQLEWYTNPDEAHNQVIFESSDERIATVSKAGLISTIKTGQVTIFIRAKSNPSVVFDLLELNVIKLPELIVIDNKLSALRKTQKYRFVILVLPYDTTEAITLEWVSSDESVAVINEKGIITCLKVGIITISANCIEYPELSLSFALEVLEEFIKTTSVEIILPDKDITVGDTFLVEVRRTPSNASSSPVWYTATPESVLKFDELASNLAIAAGVGNFDIEIEV